MTKNSTTARTRTHAHSFFTYAISYTPGKSGRITIRKDGLWDAIGFWWGLRRNPAMHNVTFRVEKGGAK